MRLRHEYTMYVLKFKTNIKCAACVNTVTPFMEKIAGLKSWSVDIQNPDRILTAEVESGEVADAIQTALRAAGYSATGLPV